MDNRKIAGALFFAGAAQFLVSMLVAERLYSGYDVSKNVISDLGTRTNALLFNSSVVMLGLAVIAAAYFLWRETGDWLVFAVPALAGLGAVGVGVFPQTTGFLHDVSAFIAFFVGGLAAIGAAFHKLEKPPRSWLSIVFGLVSLAALALFVSRTYLGLGAGGMERLVAYPVLLWAAAFGWQLTATKN